VTLFEEETIAALLRDHDIEVAPISLRRNLLTRDVPLTLLIGRRFRVGEVVLEGTELCEPCQHIADSCGMPVLEPLLYRGSIRAAILEGGELRAGDVVASIDD
jgi:MOSC domain-containing protein YiiM